MPHQLRWTSELARGVALTAVIAIVMLAADTGAARAAEDPGKPASGVDQCVAAGSGPGCADPPATEAPPDTDDGGLSVAGLFSAPMTTIAGALIEAWVGWLANTVAATNAYLMDRIWAQVNASTRPRVEASWFRSEYLAMVRLGGMLVLPFFLAALIGGLRKRSAALLGRAVVVLFASGIAAGAALVLVDRAVAITDAWSVWASSGVPADMRTVVTDVTEASLTATPLTIGGPFIVTLFGSVFLWFTLFVIWLEFALRDAAVYATTLFLPLTFAAWVWPAAAVWVKRLTTVLAGVIASKFVVIAVMAVGLRGLAASNPGSGDGAQVLVAGGAMFLVAALAPWVLLRLLPLADTGAGALEGATRRPTAAAGRPHANTLYTMRAMSGAAGVPPVAAGWAAPG